MTLEYKQSLTELNTIIHLMDVEYLSKIPQKFIDFITKNMDINYIPNIDKNIPINEQKLNKDTKVLLSLIYRNYWCDNEIKENLLHQDFVEKQKYEQELNEKYNPDNLFKNKTEKIEQVNDEIVALTEIKETSWYQRIFDNIKRFFINLFKKG